MREMGHWKQGRDFGGGGVGFFLPKMYISPLLRTRSVPFRSALEAGSLVVVVVGLGVEEEAGGRGGGTGKERDGWDGQRFTALRGPTSSSPSTIGRFTAGKHSAADLSSPHRKTKEPAACKKKRERGPGKKKSSIQPSGQRMLNSKPSAADATLSSIFIRSSARPHRPFFFYPDNKHARRGRRDEEEEEEEEAEGGGKKTLSRKIKTKKRINSGVDIHRFPRRSDRRSIHSLTCGGGSSGGGDGGGVGGGGGGGGGGGDANSSQRRISFNANAAAAPSTSRKGV